MRRAAGALVAVAVVAGLALLLWPSASAREFRAELASARGLVVGNDVRVLGAVAGRVTDVALSPRGTAIVTFTLDDGVPGPRADATAAIRPVDLLGDNYLALDPGRAGTLRGAIPLAQTSNAPRLDELLAAFRPGVRDALRLLLVESGVALDRRGADLGRATIALRPALDAAAGVAREVDAQNAALSALVRDAERGAGQLARRSRDLGPLVAGLDTTLRTVATRSAPLGAALRGAPALLQALGSTAGRLEGTARAAQPVAESLRAAAAPLGDAVAQLPQLAQRLQRTASAVRPAVRGLRDLLVRGAPTFGTLGVALGSLHDIAPQTDALLTTVEKAAPLVSKGFFVNFADQGAEPGTQPFDPFADPKRGYWRGAAVFSCEAFGVPVAPGCLQKVLSRQRSDRSASSAKLLDYLLGR
jgi:phospholipid/cholesterol/gamma-HCH transport system substrate-binding protein